MDQRHRTTHNRRPRTAPTLARPPAGFFPVNELHRHVVMAGCELVCLACGVAARTGVLPRQSAYNQAVEAFLAEHRNCA